MSKQYKIKWTQQDIEELNRVVKNYNSKISRLAKKDPTTANILPEKVSAQDLRNLIQTRQDLKREVNALKRFSKRGAEIIVDVPDTNYNVKITKWQMTEMNRRVGIINRKRNARLKAIQEVELKAGGQSLGYTQGQLGMQPAELNSLKPMTAFIPTMSQRDINMRFKSIRKQVQDEYFSIKDEQARLNFINSIRQNYQIMGMQGVPPEIMEVLDKIKNMSLKEFMANFRQTGSSFEMNYPDKEKYWEFVNQLRADWL